jgi:hypothetical protein
VNRARFKHAPSAKETPEKSFEAASARSKAAQIPSNSFWKLQGIELHVFLLNGVALTSPQKARKPPRKGGFRRR